jgi:hypothetical protein
MNIDNNKNNKTIFKELIMIAANKNIVDGFDTIIKGFVDQKCSAKKLKKQIYKYRWVLIKSVLKGNLDFVAFKNIDDKLIDFDARKIG